MLALTGKYDEWTMVGHTLRGVVTRSQNIHEIAILLPIHLHLQLASVIRSSITFWMAVFPLKIKEPG